MKILNNFTLFTKVLLSLPTKLKMSVRGYPGSDKIIHEVVPKIVLEEISARGKESTETKIEKIQKELEKELTKPEGNPTLNPPTQHNQPLPVDKVPSQSSVLVPTPLKDGIKATEKGIKQMEQHQKLQQINPANNSVPIQTTTTTTSIPITTTTTTTSISTPTFTPVFTSNTNEQQTDQKTEDNKPVEENLPQQKAPVEYKGFKKSTSDISSSNPEENKVSDMFKSSIAATTHNQNVGLLPAAGFKQVYKSNVKNEQDTTGEDTQAVKTQSSPSLETQAVMKEDENNNSSTSTDSSSLSTPSNPITVVIPPHIDYPIPGTKLPNPQGIANTNNIGYKEEIKALGELKKDENANLKPSEILINNSQKKFTTEITQDTTIKDLSLEKLIEELRKRELVKFDNGETTVNILLKNNDNLAIVGETKNKIKLSPLGQAYSTEVEKDKNTITYASETPISKNETEILERIGISIPPIPLDAVFIEDGAQKHLLIVYDNINDTFKATHYLTSKSTASIIYEKRFKEFQMEKENPEKEFTSKKKQGFVAFDTPLIIDKKDIKHVKWDEEYLNQLPKQTRDDLMDDVVKVLNIPSKPFDSKGITQEDALNMCKKHDENARDKKKHPLTQDQIKQNHDNKMKQQEKQKHEKLLKQQNDT